MIDPASQLTLAQVGHYVLRYGPKIYSLLRQEKDRFAQLEAKLDHLLMRDINSAFEIIDGLAVVSSVAMRDRHLLQAEANLLRNLGLDPDLELCGKPGRYWLAKCYFGLSCVASLRDEKIDAGRFLLRTFAADPLQAREQLATELFNEVMGGFCIDIIKHKEQELAQVPQYNERRSTLESQAFWCDTKAAAIAGAVYLGAALMGAGTRAGPAAAGASGEHRSEASRLREKARAIPTDKSILDEANRLLDTKCREIATALLEKGVYPPSPEMPDSNASSEPKTDA